MALVELNRDGMRRAFKRRRKAERRERRRARAVRFNLYAKPVATLAAGLGALAAVVARVFR